VGFQFVSTIEKENMFTLQLKKKKDSDLKDSIIHASQCLDQLACAVYGDEFTRDKYSHVQVHVVDNNNEKSARATVKVSVAMCKVQKKMSLDEYIQNIEFETHKE
ncbi:MAG: hypothetical protein PF495_04115, partial [Spirochaetales bacterium]|nr:hypothetical protein [Spirochaetales bacterium]